MEIMEAIRAGFNELIVPELDRIKEENREIRAILDLTNQRLDDVNVHLANQSRRIDEINKRIDETNKRIDETNKRIDSVRAELAQQIGETNKRMDEMGTKFDTRLDRLYEVIVRRDEHNLIVERIVNLERDVSELKSKLAA